MAQCRHKWRLWDYLLPVRLKVCSACGATKDATPKHEETDA